MFSALRTLASFRSHYVLDLVHLRAAFRLKGPVSSVPKVMINGKPFVRPHCGTTTGAHSKWDPMLLVKIG